MRERETEKAIDKEGESKGKGGGGEDKEQNRGEKKGGERRRASVHWLR
jgi:hypothetical protein